MAGNDLPRGHVTRKPGDLAVVEAANAINLTKRDVEDLIFLLRQEGVRKVIWDRIRQDGSVHQAVFDSQRKR